MSDLFSVYLGITFAPLIVWLLHLIIDVDPHSHGDKRKARRILLHYAGTFFVPLWPLALPLAIFYSVFRVALHIVNTARVALQTDDINKEVA